MLFCSTSYTTHKGLVKTEMQDSLFKNYKEFQDGESTALNQLWSPFKPGVLATAQAACSWRWPFSSVFQIHCSDYGKKFFSISTRFFPCFHICSAVFSAPYTVPQPCQAQTSLLWGALNTTSSVAQV